MIEFIYECCCGSEMHLRGDNPSKEVIVALQSQVDKWVKDHEKCKNVRSKP